MDGADRWRKVEDIFLEASELPAVQRAAYLAQACSDDDELRREVESLLRHAVSEDRLLGAVGRVAEAIADESASAIAGQRIGPYEVQREIGRGGMGAVYLAVRADDQYRRNVAIKVVKRGVDTDFILRRFRSERQILANLQHPNIAQLYDGGATEDGRPYIVLEYVEGDPISDHAGRNRLPVRDRLALFQKVCAAVHHAHRNLVVHRDLKPANILVNKAGEPKLLDFGIAKLLDRQVGSPTVIETGAAIRLMTPDYASPEQVKGLAITTATDVYALGAVLYEVLTGAQAQSVQGMAAGDWERMICEADPPKPSKAASAIDPELDNIVSMAMHKDPERRYGSVEQLSDDIDRYLNSLPVRAQSDTFAYRARKFVKRNRLAVAAAAAVAISLAGGAGVAIWQARQAADQAARAERRFQQVRKLANTFLFEFDGKIQSLPGSTEARALVVNTALDYLDSLAADARDDASLQIELAEAYERVGDVQGRAFAANLGRTGDSITSYERALFLRERAVAARPNDAVLLLPYSQIHFRLSDMKLKLGKIDAAWEMARQGLAIAERAAAKLPADPRVDQQLSLGYTRMGEFAMNATRPDEAIGYFEKNMEATERRLKKNPRAYHMQMGFGLVKLAFGWRLSGHREKALEIYQKAQAILIEGGAKEPNNAPLRRYIVLSHRNLGLTKLLPFGKTLPDYRAAAADFEKGVAAARNMMTQDSKNVLALFDVAMLQGGLGEALTPVDPKRAITAYREAIRHSDLYQKHEASHAFAAQESAGFQRGLAAALLAAGQYAEAASAAAKSIAIFEKMLVDNTGDQGAGFTTAAVRAIHASALLRLRDSNGAVTQARRCVADLNKVPPAMMLASNLPDIQECLKTAAAVYRETGQDREAKETAEKGVALWEQWRKKGFDGPYAVECIATFRRYL